MIFKIIIPVFLIGGVPAYSCEEWFKSLKIKDAKNCESECRTALTDMSSYMCRQQCNVLCKSLQKSPDEDSNFYGLTADEMVFCKENRITCLKAYKLSWSAESLCLGIYKKSRTNDESDACRHYVWSIFLNQDLGDKYAEIILNAHENEPKQPIDEKAMDLANNRLAQIDFQNNKSKKLSNEDILELFRINLKKKRLIIIDPKFSSSGGLP